MCLQKVDQLESQLSRLDSRSVTPSDAKALGTDPDESLTKVIHDLENQLETARNTQLLADEKIHQLEKELKNLQNLEEVSCPFFRNNSNFLFLVPFMKVKRLITFLPRFLV